MAAISQKMSTQIWSEDGWERAELTSAGMLVIIQEHFAKFDRRSFSMKHRPVAMDLEWKNLDSQERQLRVENLICTLLDQWAIYSWSVEKHYGSQSLVTDPITSAYRNIVHSNQPKVAPTWFVLAVRLVLVVQQELGSDLGKPFETLFATSARASTSFGDFVGFLDTLDKDYGKMLDLAENMQHSFGKIVKRDAAQTLWTKMLKSTGVGLRDSGDTPMEPHTMLKTNPVHCGIVNCYAHDRVRSLGLYASNMSCSVMGIAHLYNAARKSGKLKESWTDMDFVIAENSDLFVGDPRTAQEFYNSFLLSVGLSATSFASNKRAERFRFTEDFNHFRLKIWHSAVENVFPSLTPPPGDKAYKPLCTCTRPTSRLTISPSLSTL